MFSDYKKILVLAPHTDDGELGCGGTIARFLEEGKEVYYAAFSSAEQSVPEGMPKDVLKKEIIMAMNNLGLPENNLILFEYEVRMFFKYRQEILEDMIKLNEKINPDLVFLPSNFDLHQDHKVISQEGFRAFKRSSILGYELPWNNLTFNTDAFILLKDNHVSRKIKALECYKSQAGKSYISPEFITSLAKIRGTQVNLPYAESFEVIRCIAK